MLQKNDTFIENLIGVRKQIKINYLAVWNITNKLIIIIIVTRVTCMYCVSFITFSINLFTTPLQTVLFY